jgi:uncharacterized membrane protein
MVQVWGMIGAGLVALVFGLVLARPRLRDASGVGKVLVLGPVFEAVALAVFAAEHFLFANDLVGVLPSWMPAPLFWVYFVGVALLAAVVSFIAWRSVRWSASLLALLFVIIVIVTDLPSLPAQLHERLFWTLTVRETSFAAGAIVLAGSVWPNAKTGRTLGSIGRAVVAATLVLYAIQHFLFPRFVPGVPLDKMTPEWMPAATLISYVVGLVELVAAPALLVRRTAQLAAASAGVVLVVLSVFFYGPILVTELHTKLALEGINYVADTLLFAATILLAGLGAERDR